MEQIPTPLHKELSIPKMFTIANYDPNLCWRCNLPKFRPVSAGIKIIEYLLLHEDRELSVQDINKATHIPFNLIHISLERFELRGFVKLNKKVGNIIIHSKNGHKFTKPFPMVYVHINKGQLKKINEYINNAYYAQNEYFKLKKSKL